MRITREQINTLSKKDRIELRDKIRVIKKETPVLSGVMYGVYCIFGIILIALIVLPLWKLAFGIQIFTSLAIVFITLIKVMAFMTGILFIIDLIVLFLSIVKIEKLKETYFDIKIKARRR